MSNIFIFHGADGNAKENWFPWLKEKLEEEGHAVIVPSFPNSDEPKLNEWLEHLKKYKEQINEDSILIGHSLGAAFALRLLEQRSIDIKACFLVSAVWDVMNNEYDEKTTSFIEGRFNWELLKKKAKHFEVIHSNNDPYIALEKAEVLADKLNVPVSLVQDAGHFNNSSGYTKFDLLLEKVKEELK